MCGFDTIARRFDAAAVQHCGHSIIDELIESVTPQHQVFESPDRGLNLEAAQAPTPSLKGAV